MAEQNKNTQQNEAPRVDLRPGGGPGKGGPMAARVHVEKPKNIKKSLIRLAKYIGKSRVTLLALILLTLLIAVTELASPKLQQEAIETIRVEGGAVSVDLDSMLKYIAMMCVVFVLGAVMSLLQERIAVRLST